MTSTDLAMTLSEEQIALRDTVRAFLAEHSDEAAVRALMASERGHDPQVWAQMATQLGLQGLHVPTELGGAGSGFVEVAVVLEEMGRALLCAPYFATVVLAANALLLSGDDEAQRHHLPGIAEGSTIATLALTEASGRWDADGITTAAERRGSGWVLTGTKTLVLDGHVADLVVVVARTPRGVSLFTVDGSADGLARRVLPTLDQTRKLAQLELDATPARLLGEEGRGWEVVSRVLDLAALGLAAESIGGAQQALDAAVDYAKVRHQFGRPIGSFQAIKHTCAEILLEVEAARSAVTYGAWCADSASDELPVVACLAKAYATEAYFRAAADSLHVHGGIGFTWEHPAHLHLKRAKSSELLFGSPDHHRELLLQRLGL